MEIIASDLLGKSGIYCIENMNNGKQYIGSSKNLCHRLYTHRSYLRKGVHINNKLQNSWNKNTESAFRCFILEFCEKEKLLEREQYYIDTLNPWYNITLEVQEIKISNESREKMSVSRKEGFKKGTVKLYQEKPIYQYSLDGEFIQGFKSIKEAAQKTGVTRSSINRFLEGKYRKGGNFLWSLTKEESLPKYVKAPKDNSFNNKPIEVIDLTDNSITIYPSLTIFSRMLCKDPNSVRQALVNGNPYLKRYMIKRVCRSNK